MKLNIFLSVYEWPLYIFNEDTAIVILERQSFLLVANEMSE